MTAMPTNGRRRPLGETPRARQAWADYLAMGPGRSLERLAGRYAEQRRSAGDSPANHRHFAPTVRQLERWSTTHGWQARLQAIVDTEAGLARERHEAYVRGILEEGFGRDFERVKALKLLAGKLFAELAAAGEASRLWVRDVKGIGRNEDFREVEVVRFNAAEVRQLRGLLEDIAKETGGRIQRQEVSGQLDLAVSWSQVVARALDDVSGGAGAGLDDVSGGAGAGLEAPKGAPGGPPQGGAGRSNGHAGRA